MDEKIVNKEIRNAIKIGDINKVKQLIGKICELSKKEPLYLEIFMAGYIKSILALFGIYSRRR